MDKNRSRTRPEGRMGTPPGDIGSANGFESRTPCKFHKKGSCSLGAACKFNHSIKGPQSVLDSIDTTEKTSCSQISKFGRRPFMHLVVLHASDLAVVGYAKTVRDRYLDCGVDIFLQVTYEGDLKGSSQDIKTANLAEIVSLSNADFLVVVAVVSLIWGSWPQNLQKVVFRIESLNEGQTSTLLNLYCGLDVSSFQHLTSFGTPEAGKVNTIRKDGIVFTKNIMKAITVLKGVPELSQSPRQTRGVLRDNQYAPNHTYTSHLTILTNLKAHLLRKIHCILLFARDLLLKVGQNDPTCILLAEESLSLVPQDDTQQTPPDALLDTPLEAEEDRKKSDESLGATNDETSDSDLYGGVVPTMTSWEDFILPEQPPNSPITTPNWTPQLSPNSTPTKDDQPDTSTEQASHVVPETTTSPGRPYSLDGSPFQPLKKANVLLQYEQGLVHQAPPSPKKQKPKCDDLILFPDNMYSFLDFQDPRFIKIQSIWLDDDDQSTEEFQDH